MTDTIEEIRARHEANAGLEEEDYVMSPDLTVQAHADRATLLRHVDRLSAEMAKERERRVKVEGWRTMDSAPKGNGDQFESVTDPGYIAPPEILILFEDGSQCVARWDWYYAPDGHGHAHAQGGQAWVAVVGGELAHLHFGSPTHWRPLPTPPATTQHEDTP